MLAVPRAVGLTGRCHVGKTSHLRDSKQGMTTHSTPVRGVCRAPGPPVDVVAWRTCRLREAGFPPILAAELAAQRVDLHELLGLVDAGCPPELAARILSPLDGRLVSW